MEKAFLISIFMGSFILIGGLIGMYVKNKNNLTNTLLSFAIGVIIPLLVIELIPEIFAIFNDEFKFNMAIIAIVLFIGLGILILKILDKVVPDHDHACGKDLCEHNFYHIGIMSFIAVFLHDFIEGMGVFLASSDELKTGFFMALGVGFHNVPLGALIGSTISKGKQTKSFIFLIIMFLSPIFAGLLVYTNANFFMNEIVEGILLAITSGMLIYIVIFELIPKIEKNIKSLLSVFAGLALIIISMSIV